MLSRWLAMSLFLALLVLARPAAAEKVLVVNRIVAVVDDEPLTSRDLRARMVPFERKLVLDGSPVTTQARAALARKVLESMIEETLIAHAADRARISVSPDDLDRAIAAVAKASAITVPELIAALPEHGFTLVQYRTELRRQLVEYKYLGTLPGDPFDASASEAEQRAWNERRRLAALRALREECWVEVRL